MSIIKIGRDPGNDIVVNDHSKRVSSLHATLEKKNNKYFLTDKSSNGTFVNGRKIPKEMKFPVTQNDEIVFAGQFKFDWKKVPGKEKPSFKLHSNAYRILGGVVLFLMLSFLGYKFFPSMFSYNAKNLYSMYNKSVVLIYHKYYYTIDIDGIPAIYIGLNSNREYDYNLDPKMLSPIGIEGTGFFISDK